MAPVKANVRTQTGGELHFHVSEPELYLLKPTDAKVMDATPYYNPRPWDWHRSLYSFESRPWRSGVSRGLQQQADDRAEEEKQQMIKKMMTTLKKDGIKLLPVPCVIDLLLPI